MTKATEGEERTERADEIEVDALSDVVGDVPEYRRGEDRRKQPTPMFSRYMLWGGRRRHVRRDYEREGSFVDIHGPGVLFVVLAIVALNLLDAYFTLLFLSHGGKELNPFVQWVLESDWHPWPFIALKTVGIGVACVFLLLAKYFRAARLGMAFVFGGYTLLLCWHLFLFQSLPD